MQTYQAIFITAALALGIPPAAQANGDSPFPVSTGLYGESPFPASGWYGVVPPAPGASNYSGRFDAFTGYGAGHAPSGDPLYVATKLFPPLLLVMLPVMAVGLVARGISAAVPAEGGPSGVAEGGVPRVDASPFPTSSGLYGAYVPAGGAQTWKD